MVITIDLKSDEGKASGATRLLFTHNCYIDNLTKLFHVAFNVNFPSRVENAPHEVLHKVGLVSNRLLRILLSLNTAASLLLLNNRCQILLQLLKHQSKLLLILLGSCWLCMMAVGLLLVGWKVTSGLRLLCIAGKRGATAGRGHYLKLLRWLLLVRLPSLVLHGLGSLLWCRLVILLHQKSLDLTKRIGRINTTGGLRGLLRILSALQLTRQHGQ